MLRNPPDFPLALPAKTLLDHAAAEICIEQAGLCAMDGVTQDQISDAFLGRESGERLGLEKTHQAASITQVL